MYGLVLMEFVFCHEFTVAEIVDHNGITGMDFLEQHDAMMRISKGLLHIAGTQVQLEREATPVCTRVKLSKKGCQYGSPD